jgi:hypothetical protein
LDRPDFRQRFLDGSSLNGLGKKYALVDHLQSSDVTDVLAALKCENLLLLAWSRNSHLDAPAQHREWLLTLPHAAKTENSPRAVGLSFA